MPTAKTLTRLRIKAMAQPPGIKLLAGLLLMLVSAFANAQAPTNGLWLQHKYNEASGSSAADSSSNGHTATLYGGATWVTGQTGNAVNLDGANDYGLVTTSDLNQITGAVTISAWIYLPAPTPDWAPVVSRQIGSTGDEYYFLGVVGTSVRFYVTTSAGTSNYTVGPTITTGTWHHIVGTYDGASVKLYVDSALSFSVSHTGTFASDTNPLVIGGNVNSGGGPVMELFGGRIDNLRIYTRAVSAAEALLLASEDNAAVDTQAPTTPGGVTASPNSSSQITLTWNASTDNVAVTAYLIERCSGVGCNNFSQISSQSTTTFVDTGLSASTTYQYRVRARDAANNMSGYSSTATAATASVGAPTNGLLLQHRYNETSGSTASDSSGNGHAASLYGGVTWVTGQAGSAVSLDGIDDYGIVTTTDLNQISSAVTLSAWVYLPAATSDWAPVVSRQLGSSGYEHYFLGVVGTSARFFVTTSSGESASSSGVSISTGAWHHLVGTYDGTSVKLYVDAALGFSVAHTGTFATDTNPLVIGGNVNSAGGQVMELFPGRIDNLRIYTRAVTLAEAALLANENNSSSDSQAPSVPGGLSASANSSSQITVSWSASTDNVGVTGYVVERCGGSGCSNFSQVATPSGTTLVDTGLAASTSYSYRVRAKDASNNMSGYSSTATATTQSGVDSQPPSQPTSLTATPGTTTMQLSWTASTDNVGVTSYIIERCQGACTSYTQIGTTSGTTYNDSGLLAGVTYGYRVRAVDGAGNSSTNSNNGTGVMAQCD